MNPGKAARCPEYGQIVEFADEGLKYRGKGFENVIVPPRNRCFFHDEQRRTTTNNGEPPKYPSATNQWETLLG